MEEKDPKRKSRPGIPEALDPSIGNGASWESDDHYFILKSVDPLQHLDELLLDESTRQLIIEKWNHQNGDAQNGNKQEEKSSSLPPDLADIPEGAEIKPLKSKEKKKQKGENKIKAEMDNGGKEDITEV